VTVGRYSYVAILAFVMAGCLWLEVALRTRVFRRWRRLVLSILPAVVIFYVWDVYAVAEGHWWFDTERILGVYLPGSVPFDEVLFFVAIPIASILTLEAVRSVKPHWGVGDEPSAEERGVGDEASAEERGVGDEPSVEERGDS
jgi:lycopene cyclase domain-containing protein